MKILVVIILFCLLVCIINYVICNIYCRLKKKMDADRIAMVDNGADINRELGAHEKGIKWVLKQYLNGWMLFMVRHLGKHPSQKYRLFMLKHVFRMDIERDVVIYGGFTMRAPWNISVGKGTVIGNYSHLDGRNGIVIGENVNFSTSACIYTEQHDINDPYFRSLNSGGKVVINDRAWISSRTTVLPGITVGEGAVLASGAVAVRDLDPFTVYGGVPAKKIGDRSKDLRYEFDGSYLPFI